MFDVLTPTAVPSLVLGLLVSASACSTPEQTAGLGAALATGLGAYAPTNEIEQIYYLGVLDPQEQIPQAVYRVRVRGQASFLSQTKFASGWAPAAVVDSLGGKLGFDQDDNGSAGTSIPELTSGRRFVVFGPEGFRQVPKDHRLVLVMGSSPEAFFEGISDALGKLSEVRNERLVDEVQRNLLDATASSNELHSTLLELERDLARDRSKS